MESKFIYFKKRQKFDSVKESFPANLSPLCFIEDTNEIWFNNHFFQAGHESISVSEMDNIVTVSLSEDSFNISPGSESITVRKGNDNNIIISCSALTQIDTDDYLEWSNNTLSHKDSGIDAGTYGSTSNSTGTNAINTININVDSAGHIKSIGTVSNTIRDYTEQKALDTDNKDRRVLLAERDGDNDDTNVTRKSKVTFNNSTELLTVPKIKVTGAKDQNVLVIDSGNIKLTDGYVEGKIKGDIEGSATPKIHISAQPNYGGASLRTYGHVMLVDIISDDVEESSSNEDLSDTTIEAKAASPYAVKKYFDDHKMIVKAYNSQSNLEDLNRQWQFGEDFKHSNNTIEINWKEY